MPDNALDPRLAADTLPIAEWRLSALRLMNDRRFPWLILIPRQPELVELHDLDAAARADFTEEIALAARALKAATNAHKINIGALGNIVRQLHMHVVARFPEDPAWPGPVWGFSERVPYPPGAADGLIEALRAVR